MGDHCWNPQRPLSIVTCEDRVFRLKRAWFGRGICQPCGLLWGPIRVQAVQHRWQLAAHQELGRGSPRSRVWGYVLLQCEICQAPCPVPLDDAR
ncbi:hypothetical protein MRX96_023019 [Rhipicephalus microplus]